MYFLMKIFKDVCQKLNLNQDSRLEVGTFFFKKEPNSKSFRFCGPYGL